MSPESSLDIGQWPVRKGVIGAKLRMTGLLGHFCVNRAVSRRETDNSEVTMLHSRWSC